MAAPADESIPLSGAGAHENLPVCYTGVRGGGEGGELVFFAHISPEGNT